MSTTNHFKECYDCEKAAGCCEIQEKLEAEGFVNVDHHWFGEDQVVYVFTRSTDRFLISMRRYSLGDKKWKCTYHVSGSIEPEIGEDSKALNRENMSKGARVHEVTMRIHAWLKPTVPWEKRNI